MKFGTIGAGTVALAFARQALAAGHQVVLSCRHGPNRLSARLPNSGTARRLPRWRRRQA